MAKKIIIWQKKFPYKGKKSNMAKKIPIWQKKILIWQKKFPYRGKKSNMAKKIPIWQKKIPIEEKIRIIAKKNHRLLEFFDLAIYG